ncbi:MAG: glycosyltransferase family 4 protein [Ginsengibacter sp.]
MKICFWGNIAKAITGNTGGGGELQMALLAIALAKGGHEVVIIDYGASEDFVTTDGIKIFKIKGWNDGIRMIRTFTHRLPQLYRALKKQKADVYYCRIRDFRHILAFRAARKVKAKFVLGLASDLDAMNFASRLKFQLLVSPATLWSFFSGSLIEIVYPYLLRNADLVLVQHQRQKDILSKKNIRSVVFFNIIEPTKSLATQIQTSNYFIYVGSLDKRKGFVDLFNLIKKTPSLSYKVIGQPRDRTARLYYEELKKIKNVTLSGRLSHSETIQEIANSKALISTSPMEGFPNIFIEAWASGIPVFSLYFDPCVIEKEKLGKVAHGNLDELIEMMKNNSTSEEFAIRAKSYVENHHVLNSKKICEINEIINGLFKKEEK